MSAGTLGEEGVDFQDLQKQKEQIAEIKEVFSIFEDRYTNKAPVEQFEVMLRLLGLNPTREFTHRISFPPTRRVSSVEPSEESCSESTIESDISFEQFVKAAIQAHRELVVPTFEDMVQFVRPYDGDGDGFLTLQEIKQLLSDSKEKLSEADYLDILEECGADPDDIQGKVEIGKLVRTTYNLKD